jgi:signal transduction histidine kinase
MMKSRETNMAAREASSGTNGRGGRCAAAVLAGVAENVNGAGPGELGRALGELELLSTLSQAVIHNIPSGIAVLAGDGRLLYCNASFRQVWGIAQEHIGEDLREAGGAGPLGEIDWPAELARLAADGQPRPAVTVECGQWPTRRVVRYGLFPLPGARFELPERLVGESFCLRFMAPEECAGLCRACCAHSTTWTDRHALLVIDDVTEQSEFEAQLIQSEKLAAMGQLSAGVAHEMRNPLSAIYSAAFYIGDVLSDEEPDLGEVLTYVALIRRNVERAQRIVNNILTFAQPTGPERVVADLAEMAEQTLAILDKALVDQGVALRTELSPGASVRCRPEAVKQALLNLIVNALQAMPAGGTLTVGLRGADSGHPGLVVGDTGSGIAPELLSQIFNPFFTTKPAGQGTGLGLSIARQAVEADGGRVTVESELGRGTTFCVTLPHAAEEK